MEKMNDLRDLLKHEIEDLLSAEEQITQALPKMIEKAGNPDLKKSLQEHLRVTEQHRHRLDKIMQELSASDDESKGKKKGILGLFGGGKHVCKGMKGIIEEGETILNSNISPEARDAAIIASAQKVEHYEICGYGTARSFARELGLEQMALQLEQTLNEEYYADDLLTQLAVQRINEEAETPSGGSTSASSKGRSAGRVKDKASKEVEMETVNSSRNRSALRSANTATSGKRTAGTESATPPKSSGAPRNESGRAGTTSRRSNTSARNTSSGTTGRGNTKNSSSGRSGSSQNTGRGRR